MSKEEITTTDFIQAMVNDKPVDAAAIFDNLVGERVDSLVSEMGDSITKNLFNGVDEEDKNLLVIDLNDLTEEQIDELKKSTLASYIKKASHNASNKAYSAGRKDAESDEVNRFTNRHMKNKGDDYKHRKTIKKAIGAHDAEKDKYKADKRLSGIQRATSKLAKEENNIIINLDDLSEEQINELKKSTLGRYIKKSIKDKENRTLGVNNAGGITTDIYGNPKINNSNKAANVVFRKQKNRNVGIHRAIGKLAKEDNHIVINLDDLSEEQLNELNTLVNGAENE